ncbi:MAG: U32 family peptidase C-terminal domain-containing protein, partial [Anaerolineales bacterium]|nr:U32 family peptidase C-terminal domain-containing protein [Anaerolineales bacterium]
AHSCRWHYKVKLQLKDGTSKEIELNDQNKELFNFLLEEDYRPGELMEIEEDAHGSYILNAKDLCLMPKLDAYLNLGIDSLKVEGRNKSAYYAAVVARAYRMAIDDWYADPESWSYEDYMDELLSVPNRGFTLAFHDGRLQNLAHNYEDAHSLSTYEFAGWVTAVNTEFVEVEIKNRILAGDVLEFVSPGYRDTVRIRLYEFALADGTVRDAVHPGQGTRIRIPLAQFDREDPDSLLDRIPTETVVRKDRLLRQDEWNRLKLDNEAQQLELGQGNDAAYEKKRVKLAASMQAAPQPKRAPRQGAEGCCGKGCNGCLIFAHDPVFEEARSALEEKKMGERLSGVHRLARTR